jgi:hypothetical protein
MFSREERIRSYCVPHRFAGRRLTLKADSSSVTIYDRVHEIVS